MYCKYEVSLYSFVIGIMVSIFLFYRNKPSDRIFLFHPNKQSDDNVLGFLIFFYSCIQMSESYMWLKLSKKDVNTYMGYTKTERISWFYILYLLVLATGIGLYFDTKNPIIILIGIGVLIHRLILYNAGDNC